MRKNYKLCLKIICFSHLNDIKIVVNNFLLFLFFFLKFFLNNEILFKSKSVTHLGAYTQSHLFTLKFWYIHPYCYVYTYRYLRNEWLLSGTYFFFFFFYFYFLTPYGRQILQKNLCFFLWKENKIKNFFPSSSQIKEQKEEKYAEIFS